MAGESAPPPPVAKAEGKEKKVQKLNLLDTWGETRTWALEKAAWLKDKYRASKVGLWGRALFNQSDIVLIDKVKTPGGLVDRIQFWKREKEKGKKEEKKKKEKRRPPAHEFLVAAKRAVQPIIEVIDALEESPGEADKLYDRLTVLGGPVDMVIGREEPEAQVDLSMGGLVALGQWTPEAMAEMINLQLSNAQVVKKRLQLSPKATDVYGYLTGWKMNLGQFVVEGGKVKMGKKELEMSSEEAPIIRKMYYSRLGVALAYYIFAARGEIPRVEARAYASDVRKLLEGGDRSWWSVSREAALTAGVEWPELPGDLLKCDIKQLREWARLTSPYLPFEYKAMVLLGPKGEAKKKEIKPQKYSKKMLNRAARHFLELLTIAPGLERALRGVSLGERGGEEGGMDWLVELRPETLKFLVDGRMARLREKIAQITNREEIGAFREELADRIRVLAELSAELEEVLSTELEKKSLEIRVEGVGEELGEINARLKELESQPHSEAEKEVDGLKERKAEIERRRGSLREQLSKRGEKETREGEEPDIEF